VIDVLFGKTYKNYIGGRWVSSSSGKTFVSTNPTSGKAIAKFQSSTEDDVRKAVDAAEQALPAWSEIPAPQRGQILLKIASIFKKRKKELGKLVSSEMGKVILEGEADVQEAIDIFEYMAGEGRRLFGHTTTSELTDKFAMTIRVPVGVVACITPWNFPIAIPAWKISTALICGDTIVFKPSSDTPLCAVEFVKVLEEAGVPKGVVNLVTCQGGTFETAITDDRVRGVYFTGHKDTGRRIMDIAGIKKVSLELGSKNAVIVMDDADIDLAVDGIVWAAFGTQGQRCTACSRVIVHEKIKHIFEQKLVDRVKKIKVGNPLDPKTELGPVVNKAQLEKVTKYLDIGKREGARLLHYGGPTKGLYFLPTVFTDCRPDMNICKDEIFGPILAIISCSSLQHAMSIVNSVDYGLVSSIYTKNISDAMQAAKHLETGITYINAPTIGAEVHLPFGGVKKSGSGREAGINGIDEYSHIKTIYVDYSGRLQRAQIEPYVKK
jgi:acyl-CoA reductase-like NAD-dependent aldehyde dehydrogenase